jgi:hypothetical protein
MGMTPGDTSAKLNTPLSPAEARLKAKRWEGGSIMRVSKISLQFAAFVMLLFFIACAATKFTVIWKDETYQGHPEKILVINAFPNHVNRRLFEDELVKTLKDRRIDAVVSYNVMPNPVVSDQDAIAAQARKVSADTVLINRATGTRMDESGGHGNLYYEDLYIITQTDVYDMKSNRLVLSDSAETWIRQGEPYSSRIHSYVIDLVNKLSRQGLFKDGRVVQ